MTEVNPTPAPVVELKSIRLAASGAQSAEPQPTEILVRLMMNRQAHVLSLNEAREFLIATEFTLSLAPEEDLEAGFLQVSARFHLLYQLPADSPIAEQAELLPFAESTAMFQVWPYWREFANATILRMGYPAVEIPVMALGRDLANEGWKPVPQVATGSAAESTSE